MMVSGSWRPRLDPAVIGTWLLAGGLVAYLGLNSGGYDPVFRNRVGVVIWWIVLAGAAFGILGRSRPSRSAWLALALFGGFIVWTAVAISWSLSAERSVEDLSLVIVYGGVLLLSLLSLGSVREQLSHALAALSCAVALLCGLAVIARLVPGFIPAAQRAIPLLPSGQGRLAWPLDYWNGLAALAAMGVPLLLRMASTARAVIARALAAAAIPVVALCAYLTFSRGGLIEMAAALLVFFAFSDRRWARLGSGLLCAAGAAVAIIAASARPAVQNGLAGAVARHQGTGLLLWLIGACAAVALAHVLMARLALPRPRRASPLQLSPRAAGATAGGAVVVLVLVALLAGAPHAISKAWTQFKRPSPVPVAATGAARFGSASGEGRYTYWKVAVEATSHRILTGSGPGTFQLLWLPRAPFFSYVENAHSLYVETYAEEGLVGLLLLAGFFATAIVAAIRRVLSGPATERGNMAAILGAISAFLIGALFDWVWQMPVLAAAVLVLCACALAGGGEASAAGPAVLGRWPVLGRWSVLGRMACVALAALALVAIGIPLATDVALRRSQADASRDASAALAQAANAAAIEPYAASPALQEALVLEQRGQLPGAVQDATRATRDEAQDWRSWLVLSRLQAESGRPRLAVADYRRARSLNPRSPLFAR